MNYYRAIRLIGRTVVLCRPRDEKDDGYYGTARILGVEYDYANSKWLWIALGKVTAFGLPIPLRELFGTQSTNDTPFHVYSRTLRPISPYEMERLLERGGVSQVMGFEESLTPCEILSPLPRWTTRKTKVSQKLIRDELLTLYGPACVLTEKLYTTLNGRFCETQTGHVIALRYFGPDILQNTLPMCSIANWHWDNGIVSLTNAGKILLSERASPHAKELFGHGRQVRFANSQVWPKAEYLEWHRDNIFQKGHQAGLIWKGVER
ncbi:hypothetical protein [Devosia rhizoryzae]|uniref:HNH endonuclease n=1 Tax=Devosia rhizoryzae TaxID=2774137 RepID=A0ABX7C9Q7_9HYPH|nr:hypothetical protein [Devosia rhizoryzae]QQR39447.1 hypothetical protein JI748_17330 [Devosia rhizoryzae]